jgi:ABC-type transport system substrate-binding protein
MGGSSEMILRYAVTALLLLCLNPIENSRAADTPYIGLSQDPTSGEVTGGFKPGSHVKMYLPNLPYLAISHAVNASLVRPADNPRGWQYDLAKSHKNYGDKIWEFTLRKGVTFQDGTLFNADSIIENMAYFEKAPFSFSKLPEILERVEKIDDYNVRFHLSKPYGVFLHDANWLQFYTTEYLEKFGWNGKPTCPNLAAPGPYGLGPFILTEGYVEGDRRSPKVVLKANQKYWGKQKPKIETITIYNDLSSEEAREKALESEGQLDISPVSFADQIDVVLSNYAKLAISPSQNNYAMHFNMLSGHAAMRDERIRFVVNNAINQESLLNLWVLWHLEVRV